MFSVIDSGKSIVGGSGSRTISRLARWLLAAALTFVSTVGPAGEVFAQSGDNTEETAVLVSFTEKPGNAEKALIADHGGKVKREYRIVPAVAASVPRGKLESLRRSPRVASVDEDITVKTNGQTVPWGVDKIGARTVHGVNKGRDVKVAVLDTGIDLGHPDLKVAGNVSFVPGIASGNDDNGHGTTVAGIIAALDNGVGVVGVAPEAELYSVKVLDRYGSGSCSWILAGIEWAVDNRMQVVNMSFGTPMNLPSSLIAGFDAAYRAGIVLVAGAGNGGGAGVLDIIWSPARYESVIAVGATDPQDARASFSSSGAALELMAPGVDILSTSRGGGYGAANGTSFSAPHAAGAAALLIASGAAGGVDVRSQLQASAQDLGASGRDSQYGYGLLNASRAAGVARNSDAALSVPTIELSGLAGNQGWYRSQVAVKLAAGPGLEAEYSLDYGATWLAYTGPFTLAREGVSSVQARSCDKGRNKVSLAAHAQVKIDRMAPAVSISATPAVLWPANNKQVMVDVQVTSSAADLLSGLSSYQVTVKDEYGQVEPVIGQRLQARIQLEARRDGTDRDGRVYTISIAATDQAGNTATAQTTVTVPHDNGKAR